MQIKVVIDVSELRRKMERAGRTLDPRGLLKAIGEAQLRWIGENFRTEGGKVGGWAPLAPNTLAARRGGGAVLQDSGKLRQSFTYSVIGDNLVEVGTNVPYAVFHEEGTGPYVIRPVNAKVLAFMTVDGMVFAKEVHHPGLPRRRLLPTVSEAREISIRLVQAKVKQLS